MVADKGTSGVVQAMLGLFPGTKDAPSELAGFVINVNVPHHNLGKIQGFHMAHQGMACVFPRFVELPSHADASTSNGAAQVGAYFWLCARHQLAAACAPTAADANHCLLHVVHRCLS